MTYQQSVSSDPLTFGPLDPEFRGYPRLQVRVPWVHCPQWSGIGQYGYQYGYQLGTC